MATDDLFLIDSTFLLRASESAFLGAPLLVDSNGRDHTRAYGVVRDILRLRKRLGIRRGVIIVGRESIVETTEAVLADLLSLLPQVKATVLRDDSAPVVDICARYVAVTRWIVSANWTMSQLVTENLGILIPSENGDLEAVTQKSLSDLGIRPDQVAALLALSGGEEPPLKRSQAIRLLELYGSLETALADACCAPSADWKRKLAPRTGALLQRMAEIQVRPGTQPTPGEKLDGPFFDASKESTEALRSYGFWSLLRLLPLPDATVSGELASAGRETDYTAIRNGADLRNLEESLSNVEVSAIDTETTGRDPRTATLLGISLSVKEGHAFFVPMMKTDLHGLSPDDLRSRLNKLFSRELRLIGHNLKYDIAVLRRHGIEAHAPHFDTMLAAYDCFGDWEFWNLAAVAKKLLGASIMRYRDIVSARETFLDRPFKELLEHACTDADMALRLHVVLMRELQKRHIAESFFAQTMAVERFLLKRELDGVCVDMDRLASARDAVSKSADALRAAAVAAAGSEFDVDSAKATADALRKLGIWQTMRPLGEAQLEQLAPDYPLAAHIVKYRRKKRRYRELEMLCSAEKSGRVYPSFSQMKAPYGYVSSSSPSLAQALAVGAVADKELIGLYGNAETALETLRDASGDSVLYGDLKNRRDEGNFIPGKSAADGVPHGEILLAIAAGQTDPAICRRFLIKTEHAVAIRRALALRYPSYMSD